MTDSNESRISQPEPVRVRGPLRLLSIGLIASSSVLFVCAGCCFLTMLPFRPHELEGPTGTDQVASNIVDWTLPTGFSGKSGSTIDNFILRFDVARYVQEQGRGSLVVGQMHSKSLPFPDQQTRIQDLIEKYAPELRKINIDHSESRALTIRDLPGKFDLGQGEDRASMTRYHQVIGHFRGKLDDVILILQYEDGILTDQQVDDFLSSIK